MTEGLDGFATGEYHKSFGRLAERPRQRKYLNSVYERALVHAQEAGWGNPFQMENAEVLLCGTGSTETSSTFVQAVRDQNPDAKIHILDRESFPLDKSRERLTGELGPEGIGGIDFRQEDALHTSLEDGSISAIETDLFLQFFSPETKRDLIQEWARILRPGGVVMTRDLVQSTGKMSEKAFANLHSKLVARKLHVPAHSTTTDELQNLFKEAGLEVKIIPGRLPVLNARVPLFSHIIAHKPPEESDPKLEDPIVI